MEDKIDITISHVSVNDLNHLQEIIKQQKIHLIEKIAFVVDSDSQNLVKKYIK